MTPLYRTRRRRNFIASALMIGATGLGLGWLVLILGVLIRNGVGGLSLAVFTENTPPPGGQGGLLNPIIGSLMLTFGAVVVGTSCAKAGFAANTPAPRSARACHPAVARKLDFLISISRIGRTFCVCVTGSQA